VKTTNQRAGVQIMTPQPATNYADQRVSASRHHKQ
jgi:hypothetical protein